ncbi:unnamed protein product [Rhizoctonia solani]|uniref:Microsomal glutathione S-transferase 3 n=1 Tax=Rhizoctonia solani TaxID=456999 RepID=A0A8H2Y4U3_9AGAM|nr:unnamed protein product [Rhizoctonia solani]
MSTTITIPVLIPIQRERRTGFLTAFQTALVAKARKKSGIQYPRRAHQNTLEWLPHVLFFTTFLGLRRPVLAASLGGLWSASRVLYTIGYTTGDPKKRNTRGGIFGSVAYMGLLLGATYAGVELALGQW